VVPRILLLLNQMPQDPVSGAARSMRVICEFLAASGMEVRALATTATEGGGGTDATVWLHDTRGDVQWESPPPHEPKAGSALRLHARRVRYELLDTGDFAPLYWEEAWGDTFDRMLTLTLQEFRPQIVFTFGGTPAEMRRRKRARESGAKIIFGLRNLNYMDHGAFEDVDAVLTGSRFVTERYRSVLGIESTPLPLPIDASEVIAPDHEKLFVTYINPSVEKGIYFAARLFEELSQRRPDIPILVIESRGTTGMLVAAGLRGGFDLRRHANIMTGKTVARPAEIFSLARVIVAPSVWEEPAGRVAAEAVINGIPPIVSDRGGLPEVCNGGGFVLPLPKDLTLESRMPVASEAVEPWLELLLRLSDDEAFYAAACQRAAEAGKSYRPEILAPLYVEFFEKVLSGACPPPGR